MKLKYLILSHAFSSNLIGLGLLRTRFTSSCKPFNKYDKNSLHDKEFVKFLNEFYLKCKLFTFSVLLCVAHKSWSKFSNLILKLGRTNNILIFPH